MNRGSIAGILLAAGLWLVGATASGGPPAVEDLMARDPSLEVGGVASKFSPKLMTLWLQALARPDAELRRQAAATIVIAKKRGMEGLEAAAEPLREALRNDQDVVVRRAAAGALVALGAREAADDLAAAAAKDGIPTASVVEPALAAWDYEPLRAVWLERLTSPDVAQTRRVLAVEALGTVREPRAVEPLTTLVARRDLDSQTLIAAARALGMIRDEGLAPVADELVGRSPGPRPVELVAAALLLVRQSDAAAINLLKTLATAVEPAAARPALERLYALDPAAARNIAGSWLAGPDAGLRATAARMIAAQEDVDAVQRLQPLLADRNPGVRKFVAERYVEFGGREALRGAVLEAASKSLADSAWRGLEQAALVLGTLDHKPAAPRFLELLTHERPEVMVTAAWGLRRLRLPETLAPALQHAQAEHAANRNAGPLHFGRQLSQLFQLFGDLKYRPAEPLLRQYVPKGNLDVVARMAACWALGHFYADQPDSDLTGVFAERLADVASPRPEYPEVRLMCAVSLGRMKGAKHLEALRRFAVQDTQYSLIGSACYWSVEQITGEKPPKVETRVVGATGWFLEPTHE